MEERSTAADTATSHAADDRDVAIARIYAEYQRNLKAYNAFDFDDLILAP